MRAPRVLVAGLFHETHTFLEGETPWEAFDLLRDEELFRVRGDSSPLGGALEVAARAEWDVIPTLMATATPGATVSDDMFTRYWDLLATRIGKAVEAAPLDAVFLVLHGAMVCRSIPDVEGELLERMRKWPGLSEIPFFGVYDLHANYTQRMARLADCLVAYRCNPHTDGRESAERAANLLNRALQTPVKLQTEVAQPPLIWPPTGTGTDTDPMKSLVALARQLQANHPEFWEVNVNAGFSYADIPEAGVSFSIVTEGDPEVARAALARLCESALRMAEIGNVVEEPADEVLAELDRESQGLTVLVEPADNIGGGSPGDCTGLIRAMLDHELPNCAACLCDPAAVAELSKHQPGDTLTLPLGGRGSGLDPGPMTLEVELLDLRDGHFELCDKQSHLASMVGDRFDMGPCAVVRHGELTLLLTTHKTPPMDLGQWKHMGIDPARFSFVAVKAAVSHRRAWDPISARNVWVGTAGPCSSCLSEFPYRYVRRPVFPLDPLSEVSREK